jgi:hypothetical protein
LQRPVKSPDAATFRPAATYPPAAGLTPAAALAQTADAIALGERVTAEMARILGPENPDTVAVANGLGVETSTAAAPAREPTQAMRAADWMTSTTPAPVIAIIPPGTSRNCQRSAHGPRPTASALRPVRYLTRRPSCPQ